MEQGRKAVSMSVIKITGAYEGSLKHISLEIPKNKLVVFTGVSGSGKSTLLIDVLFQECQRQYLEAMSLQGIQKPKVERIQGVSPAIVISQTDSNKNPRSTAGTVTDVYTDLLRKLRTWMKFRMRTRTAYLYIISEIPLRKEP